MGKGDKMEKSLFGRLVVANRDNVRRKLSEKLLEKYREKEIERFKGKNKVRASAWIEAIEWMQNILKEEIEE